MHRITMLGPGIPQADLWTPAGLITAPQIWYNETSSVTDAGGGACSQWNDISGNNYHATQSTSANRPLIVASGLNGKRIIRFDGTDDDLRATSTGAVGIFQNKTEGFIFGIHKLNPPDVALTQRGYFWFSRNGSTTSRVALGAGGTAGGGGDAINGPYVGGRRIDGDSFFGAESPTAYGNTWAMCLGTFDFTNRLISLYIDGALSNQQTGAWGAGGATSNTASNGVVIGGIDSAASHFVGDIAELMAGSSLPDEEEIEKIFGWAAYKWGLQGSLPSTHKYKTRPPDLGDMTLWTGALT